VGLMATESHIEAVLNAEVVYRHQLSEDLAILRVRPDEGEVPAFVPGQFCTLGLPMRDEADQVVMRDGKVRLVRRAYSIASSADEKRYLEFYVVLVPEGTLSPQLFAMHKGDRLYLDRRISGTFTLETVEPDKDVIMVATGTGIAPFISMLRTYRSRGEKRWQRCMVIHGVRLAADLGYDEELRHIASEDPSVIYVPTATREPADSTWQGLRGRVQKALEMSTYQELVGSLLAPQTCHVMLCGNPEMIKAVCEMLEVRGFTIHSKQKPGNLHFERYW